MLTTENNIFSIVLNRYNSWHKNVNIIACRKQFINQLKEKLNDKHAKINIVCNDAVHSSDFFAKFVQCNRFLDLFAIGVHEKYQRK